MEHFIQYVKYNLQYTVYTYVITIMVVKLLYIHEAKLIKILSILFMRILYM